MARQTLTFVVLPNGSAAGGKLRLSVYMTPRLEGAATLKGFPDLLHWAALVESHGLRFRFASGSKSATVGVDQAVLRPDLWDTIFEPSTYVEKFKVPNLDRHLFVSYPARDAATFVKYAYQTMALLPVASNIDANEPLVDLLSDLMFRHGPQSTLLATLRRKRVTMWDEQQTGPRSMPGRAPGVTRGGAKAAEALPPDGIPTTLTKPPQTRDTVERFALYHNMPPAPHRPPLPKNEAGFSKMLDFHRALSALNSYPALLRALGLVFDVEVPASLCATSPASPGADYASIAIKKVLPGFKWKLAPTFFLPSTSYYRKAHAFTAAPATASVDLPSQSYAAGDVIDGLLALSPEFFHLLEVDVDGCLLNMLSLADNVNLVAFENLRNPTHPVEVEQVLPALRSGGIALMADQRAVQLLQSIRDNKAFDAALRSNATTPRPFNVRDLVRGYRIDIRSAKANAWYSLHRRDGTYSFGKDGKLVLHVDDEEGFTQLAVAQPADDPKRKPVPVPAGVPQPGTDVFVHERVARWSGWSLSVQRPGAAINRSADPSRATDPDLTLDQPMTPFKMVAKFAPVAASLPKLRFGDRYQLRVRAVDLAGNSVPVGHRASSDIVAPAKMGLPYLRFEPVPHPVLLLRQGLAPGSSLERLVIRSYNVDPSFDTAPTGEIDQRHIVPPRASVRLSEQHGMFDDAQGRLDGGKPTYDMIVARDKASLNEVNGVPLDPRPLVDTPYLPDPIARGAAFRNLPNTPENSNGRVRKGTLSYAALADVERRPGSMTHIGFGGAWPGRKALRLVVVEGSGQPAWDDAHRVLSVFLPKSATVDVALSSYLNASDLTLMGVWDWARERLEAEELESAQSLGGPVEPSDTFALLTRLALEGGHPMLTPARTITLVHAVQQPLGRPEFTMLPVVRPAGQSKALANAFSPLTAWREFNAHDAVLLGGLHIHGASTARIDVQANWREFFDDPTEPAPTRKPASASVEKVELRDLTGGPIFADGSEDRMVATYIPQGDTLWFSAPFDTLPGMNAPASVAAPVHQFGDTRHRRVRYEAVATSRFRECFADGLDFTRTSDKAVVNVPSSARPLAPDVLYVIPTFGIEQQETTNVKTAIRRGNGVRVYLNRPWYSSGENELLGVTLWPASAADPDTPTREKYKPFFTQWGLDPIWKSGPLGAVPTIFTFSNAVTTAAALPLEETDLSVDVAGHCVFFDAERKLWYCDIVVDNFSAYTPFVRLALARYQPHSLPGVELSHVVLADFVQLSPDRSAVLSVDPAEPRKARVFVGGLVPEGPTKPLFTVTVERRMANVISDAGWEVAPATVVNVTEDPSGSGSPDTMLWSGSIEFKKMPPKGQYRVVVREFEILRRDPGLPFAIIVEAFGQRLVYAAIIPYDFGSSS